MRKNTYPCTTMKNGPTEIMCSCAKRERKEDRAKLKLHCNEIDNSLQPELQSRNIK